MLGRLLNFLFKYVVYFLGFGSILLGRINLLYFDVIF